MEKSKKSINVEDGKNLRNLYMRGLEMFVEGGFFSKSVSVTSRLLER